MLYIRILYSLINNILNLQNVLLYIIAAVLITKEHLGWISCVSWAFPLICWVFCPEQWQVRGVFGGTNWTVQVRKLMMCLNGKKFFTMRPWHRLPPKAGAIPSLAVPEARLGGFWAAWAGARGPWPWQWSWVGFEVPSDPNQSLILWFYVIYHIFFLKIRVSFMYNVC